VTGSKTTATSVGWDGGTEPCVVRKGNDGIWLNFNPQVRGGFAQHVFGISGRPAGRTGLIGRWVIDGRQCDVWRLPDRNGRFDVAVMNPDGVRPFLLSAQGRLHRGFGYGGLTVHVHTPLIERLGEKEALSNARHWANHQMLHLEKPRDVIGCERISRIDYAVDVLVEKGGPDDYGPDVHEQIVSRLQHPMTYWNTGWEIGRGNTDKDRLKRAITSYDKTQERWDKGGIAGLQEYVTDLGDLSLIVEQGGKVVQVSVCGAFQEVRVWRVEFRFFRSFLQCKGISNADEAIAAMPALVSNACQTTRLHQRCSTGNVFPTNPVTRLWNALQITVT
jgi:hypothetical protein